MRVIAGQYRGRTLKSPLSLETRPTSDRLRETLFNVLQSRIEAARVLDLCAGTGALGIEALSRGAEFVTFVDKSRKMCALVEANLDLCEVPEDKTLVVLADAADFLRRTKRANKRAMWDVVFYDPPYTSDYLHVFNEFADAQMSDTPLLANDGVLIVEHHHKKSLPDALNLLRRWRVLKQGDSSLSFYNFA